jgi:hypothetical protein
MNLLGNPIHDLRLMRSAVTVPGEIIGASEETGETDYGKTIWSSIIAYRFRLPDGSEVIGSWHGSGRLPPELADFKGPNHDMCQCSRCGSS